MSGADISSLAKSEDCGGAYRRPNGEADDAIAILARHKVDCVRLKVWVDPADGYNTKERVVAIGERAERAGRDVMVDFHYSDTWADPGKQYKPAAWEGLDLAGLEAAVYDHTAEVVEGVPRGLGRGVFWWEPTWTAVEGNGWENQALFDYENRALPGLKTLGGL